MSSLCSELMQKSAEDKFEFLYGLFLELNAEVKTILSFGPCNTALVQKTDDLFHFLKNKGTFFPFHLQKDELAIMPTIFAKNLLYSAKEDKEKTGNIYEHYLQLSLQYGTGTCEFFSIVGAYFLAKKYNVALSIETIFSQESHTYIRLYTQPEYILDFWAEMVCEYNDDVTWLEVLGPSYQRRDATYRTDLVLNSKDLIAMGDRVFTEANASVRSKTLHEIENRVAQFLHSVASISPERKQASILK
ncbi:hypothetical protein J2N86_03810 [Legionella lytica]|uniref:Uncharacterized protein n=1 Tax=Legionella lytica TaxID=96232 RepID=A0ABY4Y9Y5_9GAMM|nr:hypothetical protein [Legionella lytica]USQ14458.1 hypothetical protein J2N86_03810 [Legionella lytica]